MVKLPYSRTDSKQSAYMRADGATNPSPRDPASTDLLAATTGSAVISVGAASVYMPGMSNFHREIA